MEIDPRLRPGSDSRGGAGSAAGGATPLATTPTTASATASATAAGPSVAGGVQTAILRQPSPYDLPPPGLAASTQSGYHNLSAHVSPTLAGHVSTPSSGFSGAPQGGHGYQSLPHTPHAFFQADQTSRDERDTSVAAAGDGAGAAGEDPNDPLADLKRPRACEACRQLKVRCEPDNDNPEGSCRRCAKAKRNCVVTVPSRKRQKKTDSRVAELERKIDALTASLHASRARNSDAESGRTPGHDEEARRWSGQRYGSEGRPQNGLAGNKRVFSGDLKRIDRAAQGILPPLVSRPHTPNTAENSGSGGDNLGNWPALFSSFDAIPKPRNDYDYTDVIDRRLIDTETATKAFNRYVNEYVPVMPLVVFPTGTTMAEVRRTKPLLFLAILSVAIGPFRSDIQPALVNETHRNFADRIIIRGEKSLEIIQALLLMTVWYAPPDHYEELKFYQLIHIAAVMAMDLGMNRRTKTNSKPFGMWKELMGKKTSLMDPDSPETRRAWMGCYFMGVNASMSLRRPLLIRWQPYMDECLEILGNSPNSLHSDKMLCHWMKLAHISEEIGFQFSMDDPATSVTITDQKIQYALKGFKRQLDEWRREVPVEHYSPVLRHYESVVKVYMHEVAMHIDHNIDDFKPPFMPQQTDESQADLATPVHVDALTTCLASIHDVFNLFLSFDHSLIICLPTIYMVRTSYSSVALIKLLSAASAPGSRLGQVFNPHDLRVEYYLDRIINHMKAAGERNGGRTPAKFSLVLGMLKTWFLKRKDGKATTSSASNHGISGVIIPANDSGENTQPTSTRPSNEGSAPGPWLQSIGSSNTQQQTGSGTTSLHVLSEVAMSGPGSSDSQNQYQQRTNDGGSFNLAQKSGPSPHDTASTATTSHSNTMDTNQPFVQYPSAPVSLPPPPPPQMQQPSPYPQYEQQQPLQSSVPPPLFDENGNPIGLSLAPQQPQMSYSDPGFMPDDGVPFNYEPDELAAIGDMLGDGFFNFPMDWNNDMM